MKKKKIRRCIFALWCILAIIFLIAVNIYNGNEKAENVISDLVRIYIGASFIIIGIIILGIIAYIANDYIVIGKNTRLL